MCSRQFKEQIKLAPAKRARSPAPREPPPLDPAVEPPRPQLAHLASAHAPIRQVTVAAGKHIVGGKLGGFEARPYICPDWRHSKKSGSKKKVVMLLGKMCGKPKCKMMPSSPSSTPRRPSARSSTSTPRCSGGAPRGLRLRAARGRAATTSRPSSRRGSGEARGQGRAAYMIGLTESFFSRAWRGHANCCVTAYAGYCGYRV